MADNTALLVAAQGGDATAVAAWIRASQTEVWRLCAHLVGREDADDLTQEVFLRALRALPAFRADSSARTWLLVIARRTCADAIRRRTRERRHAAAQAVAERMEDGSGYADVAALLDGLDADRRLAFVLTQMVGLSYAEAAEVCGCPIGSIRSRVARARAELCARLGEVAAV